MQALQVVTPLVTTLIVLAATYIFKDRLDRLEGKVDRLPTRDEFNALSARADRVELAVAGLRADLTQIALAVGAKTRPQTG